MNQINLDKLLQNPLSGTASSASLNAGELKLLTGELYSARLQTLADAGRLQLQTPQGRLTISLPPQLSQQIGQQFGQQMQVTLSSAANNQLNLTLQSLPAAINSITVSSAQLQPLLSQWLSQQLPQLVKIAGDIAAADPAMPKQPAPQPGTNAAISNVNTTAKTDNSLTLALQLELKSGQLQLAGTPASCSGVLLTLSPNELAAVTKLMNQLSAQPAQNNPNRQPLLLRVEFNQRSQGVQLSLQTTAPVQPATLALSTASQQQLLQALLSQLGPVKHTVVAGVEKITLGQLSISLPSVLATTVVNRGSNTVPLLLQLQAPTASSNQWQLVIQTAPQSQQLTLSTSQADRPVQLLSAQPKSAGTPQQAPVNTSSNTLNNMLNALAPETKVQAWRNLLPLLSQPLMQPNNLPSLPAPLQQLLSQIQQSLPDVSKPLAPPLLAAQINALLQFHPLQSQPNIQTAGGTLALAIQLLLGHLSQKQQAPANNTPANRLSQLVSQLDTAQAGTALRQLASLSSPLQQSQLATLDAQSQLQQWLLQLPLQQQGQTILPQLLLEQREADGKNNEARQKQWQLTMKFDLQQYGNLLAVAKLQEQDLQLQFYTDHNQALRLAEKFLPLLKDRCAAQGLTVSKAECQLGKIPDSLLPRHNSLLTVKV